MMATEFKKRASQNGKIIEKKASKHFNNLKLIFKLIDAELNGIPAEIKSCQEFITDKSRKNGLRHGRFRLHKHQHDELIRLNGVYLFIVHNDRIIKRMAVIPAKDVRFRQTVDWRSIFNNKEG